ncbi:hypothetical protein OIU13_00025 [Brevundimonas sp. BT-123]|uniref:hypothetical protein n=1 Tax=Brevundimonas sp. BT-123 TaxID=2986928 RepID=UPI002235A670|nr:hypothetical protein [Brevundimonas sp. BT-123]MCW0044925.1 hypothetical protein [Brevundimonas sp. BT-123]
MPELRQAAWLGEDIIGQAALPPLRAAMDGVALDRNAMRVHQMFAASLADGSSRWRVVLSRVDISGRIANTAPVSSHEKERGAFEFLGGLLGKPASPATAPGRG